MSFSNVSFHVNSGLIPQLTASLIIFLTVIFKAYKKAFLYIGVTALFIISIGNAYSFAVVANPCQQGGTYYVNGMGGCNQQWQYNTNYWGQPWGNPGFYPYAGLQFHTNWGGGSWGAPWYFQPHGTSPYAPYCPQCMMNNPMYQPTYNPWHQQNNNWHGPAS